MSLLKLTGRPNWLHLNLTLRAGLRFLETLLRQIQDLLRPLLGLEIRRAGLKMFPLNKHPPSQQQPQFRPVLLLEMGSMRFITVIVDASALKANTVAGVIAALEVAVVVKAAIEAIVTGMAVTEATVQKADTTVIVVEMVAIQAERVVTKAIAGETVATKAIVEETVSTMATVEERVVTKAIVEEMVVIGAIVGREVDIALVEITGVTVVIGEEVKGFVAGVGVEEEAIEEAIVDAAVNLGHKKIMSANLLPRLSLLATFAYLPSSPTNCSNPSRIFYTQYCFQKLKIPNISLKNE